MTPTPSPRHPWKALAVVFAMFAVVQGACAPLGWHAGGSTHLHAVDAVHWGDACPDLDVDMDMDDDDWV